MPRAIRTKSGRLRRGVARRRIQAAGPGEVIVLDQGRRMVKRRDGSRSRSRNSFTLDFAVATPLAFDLDMRKLVDELRLNLAEHYSLSLLASQLADGSAPLPPLSRKTQAIHPERDPDSFGVRSGQLARRWLIYPVRGTTVRASARLKPYGGEGRSHRINGWLERGIDLQSVRGDAAR
ncbi:hypothetical protein PPSIR1_10970, partial [Plesiocystis pacifica SIR-1]